MKDYYIFGITLYCFMGFAIIILYVVQNLKVGLLALVIVDSMYWGGSKKLSAILGFER